ncbi:MULTISPECIES: protein kinase domain-containing protein [unclassified Streptomyces]|uniref:protein kinase domain-containing protein n=1 Tax=unclassified Streptomyces TaxID=2593676 RepID=UPI002E8197C3|nr:PQQ-binding-like beta-propeller repeat protein [Streptomyces sp. NBC_00589]WTI37110.1 PQQ-binding-like beta-propeller repeat protein [Streptomyces sp. NBC_00775]WUB29214.1 PQQ-binding-like beta-propeller repeat protein [Streptomyces sp. NBC_00589]
METLQPDDPRELGSYRLLRRLGAGGMGRVYLARSPGGRTVAVKVVRQDLAADADFRRRFEHEVEIARAVSGRYTAPVVDADPSAALPWLATSYVLGPDLTDVVEAHGALPERTVRALGAGLAAALQEIHAAGLIHRDLKPSNVLLAADGPRVIDFGIARAVDGNRMTQTGVVVGSPGYMPPEQALGRDVGTPGDVFSLGAVLTFAATGHNAFGDDAASHAAMLYQIVHGEPDLTGVSQSLLGLIRACLQKDPAQRPAPAEIVAALAPGGTATVLTDWLPSAVASTIATHAAGILDLEAPDVPEAPGVPEMPKTPSFGPPPVMADGTASSTGTPTPAPQPQGYGYPPAPGYGTPPGGTPAPGYGTPGYGSPLPDATVHLGRPASAAASASGAAPSRRRFLGLTASVAGVAVVGGGGAWWLSRSGNAGTESTGANGKGGSTEPAAENFTTPPAGVAPQPLWHKSVAEDSTNDELPLMIHDGTLLISGDPLVAYDVKTGKARWTRKGMTRPGALPLVAGGKLFLGDSDYDGALVALDMSTGKEAWRTRVSKKLDLDEPIAIDAENVYVTVTDLNDAKSGTNYRRGIAAINHTTRKQVWVQMRDWGTDNWDVEATVNGKYLVYADSKYNLTVRDTATGKQLWTKKVGDDWSWTPTVAAGLVFLPGEKLTVLDADTGKTRWTLSPNGRRGFDNPVVIDDVLYAADFDHGVWAVHVKTGKKIWLCEDPGAVRAPVNFLRAGATLYGASYWDEGGIFAMDAKTGKSRWVYNDNKGGGEPWQVAISGNRLLATHGFEIYALPAV